MLFELQMLWNQKMAFDASKIKKKIKMKLKKKYGNKDAEIKMDIVTSIAIAKIE